MFSGMSDCMRIRISPIKIFGLLVGLSALLAIGLFLIGYLWMGYELALSYAKRFVVAVLVIGIGGPLSLIGIEFIISKVSNRSF